MAKAKKSTPAKLSPEQLQELKDAIIAGEAPKSIHERLGVSIANIGYHKGELRKKGLLATSTSLKKTAPKGKSEIPASTGKKVKAVAKSVPAVKSAEEVKKGTFKLIINGVSLYIESASSVSVGKDFVKIDY